MRPTDRRAATSAGTYGNCQKPSLIGRPESLHPSTGIEHPSRQLLHSPFPADREWRLSLTPASKPMNNHR